MLIVVKSTPIVFLFGMRELGLFAPVTVRDLWRQKDLGTVQAEGSWSTLVAPHGVVLVKLTKN